MHGVIGKECEESHNSTEDISGDWRHWCRLCAKPDVKNINIFFKDEIMVIKTEDRLEYNGAEILMAIRKCFDVDMKHEEQLPMQLCTDCLSLITSLINFNKRVIKVQQIYSELQHINDNAITDLKGFRLKYGVLENDQPHEFMYLSPGKIHLFIEKHEIEEPEEETFIDMLNENCTAFEIKIENFNDSTAMMTDEDVCVFEMLENSFGDDDGGYEMSDENPSQIYINEEINSEYKFSPKTLQRISNNTKEKQFIGRNCTQKEKTSLRNITDDDADEENDDEPYSCDECSRVFKVFAYYRLHMEREHAKTSVESRYSCSDCSISFNTKIKLKNHRYKKHMPLTVRRIFPCSYCDQKMSSKSSVEQHIRFVHMNERSIICEECGTGVRTNSELKKHMLVHTENALFECEICKKRSKSLDRLKKHMNIHSSSKHICPECGLQLKSRTTLNNHLLVHSDVRRHKCDYCERTFKRAKELKNHLILHTGLKLYSCDFCDKSYACASNLRGHKRKKHPEEVAALDASGEKVYAKNIPKLAVLKSVVQGAENLEPVICRKFGERTVGKTINRLSNSTIRKQAKTKAK